jgi:serine O-acetyltransferase
MGGIVIGDYAVVGANSVVIRDIPSHHMALGIPAMNMPIAEQPIPQPRSQPETFLATD